MGRRRWLHLVVITIVVVLVGGRWLATSSADDLWAGALGVAATHAQIRDLRGTLLLLAFVSATVWCVGNLYLVYRSIGSVHVPRRVGNVEFLEAVPRRLLLLAAAVVGVLLAVAFSHGAGGWWRARALAGYEARLGVADPILARDLAYYLFRLPWHRTVHGFATALSGVMLALCLILYAAVGAVRWSQRRVRVTALARWHLAGLLFAFALALCWGYQLEPFEYVAGIHGVPMDTVLTAVRLPVARVLAALALVTAAASLLWMWIARVMLVAVPWTVLLAASLTGHYVMPSFAGAVRTPEERTLEAVEQERDRFTALAYGSAPHEIPYDASASAEVGRLGAESDQVERMPLWDPFAVTIFLNRALDTDQPHARFTTSALDMYRTASGTAVPVIVGVRQIDLASARDVGLDLTWQRVHAGQDATTEGVAAVLANAVSEAGVPIFVPDLSTPEVGRATATSIPLARPRAAFGPGMVDYAVLPQTFGAVGSAPGGLWRRLALAWALQSPQLLSKERVPDAATVSWDRDVIGRLQRFAPFARFEQPHPVVLDERLVWVANGVVSANAFPLAPALRWEGANMRYLRSGLVGTVDAHTGETAVYLLRSPDPLSAAWAQLAAELVRPAAEIPPALLTHLRYSASAFAVQVALARQRVAGRATRSADPPMRPTVGTPAGPRVHDWVGPTPGDPVVRVRRVGALEAEDATVLAAILDASVRDGRPTLDLYRLPQPFDVPGPSQIARRFDRLRSDFQGVEGALRTIPLGDNVLMLQSSYVSPGEGFAAPQLVDVALAWGEVVGNGPTVTDALERVEAETGPLGAPASSWARARRWFERLDAARRSGDWGAFGRAYEELGRLLVGTGDSVP